MAGRVGEEEGVRCGAGVECVGGGGGEGERRGLGGREGGMGVREGTYIHTYRRTDGEADV